MVKKFPDCVEGSADYKDVAEADKEVVKEPEVLLATVWEIHCPDGDAGVLWDGYNLSQDEASDCIEQEDEQDHEDGEPSKELHVEVDGANFIK